MSASRRLNSPRRVLAVSMSRRRSSSICGLLSISYGVRAGGEDATCRLESFTDVLELALVDGVLERPPFPVLRLPYQTISFHPTS